MKGLGKKGGSMGVYIKILLWSFTTEFNVFFIRRGVRCNMYDYRRPFVFKTTVSENFILLSVYLAREKIKFIIITCRYKNIWNPVETI